ncbi:MAG: metallophosphoesterase [Kiritimatiellae bacterium]|nr:metallophosphoesterase [Kiritimatiellia bacterium]
MTRRTFFKLSSLASAAAVAAPATAVAPALKLGIISDIHVDDAQDKDALYFRQALELFRDAHVDGVILSGDMANLGRVEQLQCVADVWYSVFLDDKLPDGSHVEKLFVYGNHDAAKVANFEEKAKKLHGEDWQRHMISLNLAAAWKQCFHEEWAPIYAKTVKGYVFIGCHWGNEGKLDAYLTENADKFGLRGAKPFFYAQHPHPKDTVNSAHGAFSWGHDNGKSTAALAKFPNAVAFSGHSHYPLTNDTTIWQGAFTSVGASSTSYAGFLNGRDDGEWAGVKPEPVPVAPRLDIDCRQCLVLSVFADRMVFARHDLVQKASLGPDWICPLPACVDTASRPYAFAVSEARAKVPQFAPGVKVMTEKRKGKNRMGKEGEILAVKIPAARSTGPTGRLIEYEVTVENLMWGFTRIHTQKRMMAKGHVYADETVIKEDECLFLMEELPRRTPIRFKVTPLNCFGQGGNPVYSAEMTLT